MGTDLYLHVLLVTLNQAKLIVKKVKCKSCTPLGKKLKSITLALQLPLHVSCSEPNQEFRINFVEHIFDEKRKKFFLTEIDRSSKSPTAELFEKKTIGSNVDKILACMSKTKVSGRDYSPSKQNV